MKLRAAPSRRLVGGSVSSAVLLALAACGGGGGSEPAAPPAAAGPAQPLAFSGTVATGSPMVGATVRVIDGRGREVGRSQTVGADGGYRAELAADAQAPFALIAEAQNTPAQVSVFDRAESSVVNVTPITSLIAARLSSNGTPQGLERDFKGESGAPVPSPATIQTRTAEVVALIAPVAQAVGDSTNPVTGRFAVGGTGHDRLLDSIAVTITPKSATETNIELTVRAKASESAPMPAVSFTNTERSLPVVPAVDRSGFVAEGTAARVERLLALVNACYALPAAQRASGRDAASVLPGPCKDMFFQADPAGFLHGGSRVGPSGSFSGIFGSFTARFERPVVEYRRPGSDDVVFSLQWVDTAGNVTQGVWFARQQGDELRLIGDQYAHPMVVRPYVEWGDFLLSADGAHDFVTTGYQLLVTNRMNGTTPVYDRVEVVAPVGLEGGATRDVFVARPVVGRSELRMSGQWTRGTTSAVVRLAGDFVQPRSSAPLHPKEVESSGAVWIAGEPWSDARLERLSHKSVWTFRYFLAGNTGAEPDAVQHLTTISRAPSVREARQMQPARFTPETLEFLRERSKEPNARNVFWVNARPGATGEFLAPGLPGPAMEFSWTVPAGGVPANNLFLAGRATTSYSVPWEQRLDFDVSNAQPTTARSATMRCPVDFRSPTLCDANDPTRFSRMTMMNSFILQGTDERGVRVTRAHFPAVPTFRPMNPPAQP